MEWNIKTLNGDPRQVVAFEFDGTFQARVSKSRREKYINQSINYSERKKVEKIRDLQIRNNFINWCLDIFPHGNEKETLVNK